MNERDLQLVRVIDSEIRFDGSSAMYLLSAKYTNLVRVNLVLLKDLLDEKHKKGIIVTIDRPHQYIAHLLQLHGVDQTNLIYIDAISSFSSDTKGGSVAKEYQNGPFNIEALPEFLFSEDESKRAGMVDMADIEFVVMDNVSTMLTYNAMDGIRKFFAKYVEFVGKRKSRPVATAFVMDRDIYADLYSFISALSTKIIDIGADMTIKRALAEGQASVPNLAAASLVGEVAESEFGILKKKSVM
jgi:hypothetical protein